MNNYFATKQQQIPEKRTITAKTSKKIHLDLKSIQIRTRQKNINQTEKVTKQ